MFSMYAGTVHPLISAEDTCEKILYRLQTFHATDPALLIDLADFAVAYASASMSAKDTLDPEDTVALLIDELRFVDAYVSPALREGVHHGARHVRIRSAHDEMFWLPAGQSLQAALIDRLGFGSLGLAFTGEIPVTGPGAEIDVVAAVAA